LLIDTEDMTIVFSNPDNIEEQNQEPSSSENYTTANSSTNLSEASFLL